MQEINETGRGTMRAFRVTEPGGPGRLQECPRRDPGPGEIGIRIAACGLNFADLLMVKGTYQDTPDIPFTLGLEAAGTISAIGPEVTGMAPGDRVAVFSGHGGLAEYGVFPSARAVLIPPAMPDDVAAGFLIAYGTSHLALTRRALLRADERLVVLGAAGGVGLTAVEIGVAIGAEVVAVARGAQKLEAAGAAGAHHLIDSDTADLRAALLDLGRADIVYDAVGGAQFDAAFRAMRPEGRILSIGFASGTVPQVPANHLLVKNLSVMGVNWGAYLSFAPEALIDSLKACFAWYGAGRLRPHISARFPLSEAQAALDHLAARKSTGKVIVTMD